MNSDLRLFNELIQDEVPDCELEEKLFAYYCPDYQVEITKVSEVLSGIEKKCVYRTAITGNLVCTRFVAGKDNALIKTYLLINEHFGIIENEEYQQEEITIYDNEFDRTFNYPFELEVEDVSQ